MEPTDQMRKENLRRLYALAIERGKGIASRVLRAEGGHLSDSDIGERLGVTPAIVEQMRKRRQILGAPTRLGYRYPIWQCDEKGVIPHFADVLRAFHSIGEYGEMSWFFSPCDRIDGHPRPLDALRAGRVREVVRAAQALGVQGA